MTDAPVSLDAPLWMVIPAAGMGQRMRDPVPKQYLDLCGQPVLQRTLYQLLGMSEVAGAVVVVAEHDDRWPDLSIRQDPRVFDAAGGETRAASVVAGLHRVLELAGKQAWILVHDAVRPLVAVSDIRRLMNAVYNSGAVGGILGTPVQDTLKQADDYYRIDRTITRDTLWQAQTPQMFRCETLLGALQLSAGSAVTDEASAMELAGHEPLLVEALQPNFKITRPTDLAMARAWLEARAVAAHDSEVDLQAIDEPLPMKTDLPVQGADPDKTRLV